jgi:proteasome lid subunit RPN8/RPN11
LYVRFFKKNARIAPEQKYKTEVIKMSIGRQDYTQRREDRIERLENRAAAAEEESSAAYAQSHKIISAIPMGQPILVGHHSEKHHRRDLATADRLMTKSVEASEKANYYQGRADAARKNSTISSDDPNALNKLQDKLQQLQAAQERDKSLNAYYRKHKTLKGFEGITDEEAEKADAELAEQDASPYSTGKHSPVPSWVLSNRNGEIARLKQRLANLQQVDEMEHVEIDFAGGTLLTNEDINRVQILFDKKPDEATREKLKTNGFRWSPRESAWQTQRTPQALRRAKYLLDIKD